MATEDTAAETGSDDHGAQEQMRRARKQLMGGRGPGASPDEVAAHGRHKAMQAGVPALHRLAATERDTALLRGAPSDVIEAVHAMQVSTATRPPARSTEHPRADRAAWIVTGAAAAVTAAVVRAARRR